MGNKSSQRGMSNDERERPPQSQSDQPGHQSEMVPAPVCDVPGVLKGAARLKGKVALITGGDSGIGRAVAIAYAREGADIAIVYLDEHDDAAETRRVIEQAGRTCHLISGDIANETFCQAAVDETIENFGKMDILVNNAAEQHPQDSIAEITADQIQQTFATNVFSMFYLTKAALPYLKQQTGSTIINTTSVTAYRGSPGLLDYSATKGAIVSFTRSLSQSLVEDGIRVNAVAPGPIWTPLIPATFDAEKVSKFGSDTPMGRAGQPWECATAYVFLASLDSSYMTGQVLHLNGGEIING